MTTYKYQYDCRHTYRMIGGESVKYTGKLTFTRGTFHTIQGVFYAYDRNIKPENVEVLIQACPKCKDKSFWVRISELESAKGYIECDNCSTHLYPQIG